MSAFEITAKTSLIDFDKYCLIHARIIPKNHSSAPNLKSRPQRLAAEAENGGNTHSHGYTRKHKQYRADITIESVQIDASHDIGVTI